MKKLFRSLLNKPGRAQVGAPPSYVLMASEVRSCFDEKFQMSKEKHPFDLKLKERKVFKIMPRAFDISQLFGQALFVTKCGRKENFFLKICLLPKI